MSIDTRKEKRECKGCGYVRTVKVCYYGVPPEPHWGRYCKVCVLKGRIAEQRRHLEQNQARVTELLRRRMEGEETD